MSEWLSIIGIGENGLKDLSEASREALERAETVFGSPRHLAMVEHPGKIQWPVPFSLAPLLALRGRPVAALASGDPFWHGAGGSLAQELPPEVDVVCLRAPGETENGGYAWFDISVDEIGRASCRERV